MPYFHLVFTLPHEPSALVLQNKKLLYDLLFRTSAATLLEVARGPKHLGADIGLLSVLHTWGQNLEHHPHVHCVVPGGGLALDGSRWVAASSRFFLPVWVLAAASSAASSPPSFKQLLLQGKLQFHASLLGSQVSPERFQRFLRHCFFTGSELGRLCQAALLMEPNTFSGTILPATLTGVAISNHRPRQLQGRSSLVPMEGLRSEASKQKVMTVSADAGSSDAS